MPLRHANLTILRYFRRRWSSWRNVRGACSDKAALGPAGDVRHMARSPRGAQQKRPDLWERSWRPRPELNRGTRICNPLRHHSATWPLGRFLLGLGCSVKMQLHKGAGAADNSTAAGTALLQASHRRWSIGRRAISSSRPICRSEYGRIGGTKCSDWPRRLASVGPQGYSQPAYHKMSAELSNGRF